MPSYGLARESEPMASGSVNASKSEQQGPAAQPHPVPVKANICYGETMHRVKTRRVDMDLAYVDAYGFLPGVRRLRRGFVPRGKPPTKAQTQAWKDQYSNTLRPVVSTAPVVSATAASTRADDTFVTRRPAMPEGKGWLDDDWKPPKVAPVRRSRRR